jgi:hypothetical protein
MHDSRPWKQWGSLHFLPEACKRHLDSLHVGIQIPLTGKNPILWGSGGQAAPSRLNFVTQALEESRDLYKDILQLNDLVLEVLHACRESAKFPPSSDACPLLLSCLDVAPTRTSDPCHDPFVQGHQLLGENLESPMDHAIWRACRPDS